MFNKMKKIVAIALACSFSLPILNTLTACKPVEEVSLRNDLVASYSFESVSDYKTYKSKSERIRGAFNAERKFPYLTCKQ